MRAKNRKLDRNISGKNDNVFREYLSQEFYLVAMSQWKEKRFCLCINVKEKIKEEIDLIICNILCKDDMGCRLNDRYRKLILISCTCATVKISVILQFLGKAKSESEAKL